MTPALARALRGRGPLILDFDGPVCSLFAGYPAATVAAAMRQLVVEQTGEPPPAEVAGTDPLQILAWSAGRAPATLAGALEDLLCAAEFEAAGTATLTAGVVEVLSVATESGRRVGIASNNSAPAIRRALARFELSDRIAHVAGRPAGQPALMKPHPHVVTECATALGFAPALSPFVGDSLSDLVAARAAGLPVIALANRPAKKAPFREAAPDALVTSMAEIARIVSSQRSSV